MANRKRIAPVSFILSQITTTVVMPDPSIGIRAAESARRPPTCSAARLNAARRPGRRYHARMYLRMVFRSRPVRRAIAVIDRDAWAMRFQDHHQLSTSNHPRPHVEDMRQWRLDHTARARIAKDRPRPKQPQPDSTQGGCRSFPISGVISLLLG